MRVPSIDDFIEIPIPSDAQLSPDGLSVAYAVTVPKWETDEFITSIWLASLASSTPELRLLEPSGCKSWYPRWSPNGRYLAFLSDQPRNRGSQIYCLEIASGRVKPLTNAPFGVVELAWSPDSQQIAYRMLENTRLRQEKTLYGPYEIADHSHFYHHLWLVELNSGQQNRLTEGTAFDVRERFQWSPNGRKIAFHGWPAYHPKYSHESSVYTVELATRCVRKVANPPCEAVIWSPDGNQLAFNYCPPGEPWYFTNGKVATISAQDGGGLTIIGQSFDENPELLSWGKEGIYFHALQGTSRYIFCLNPVSQECKKLTCDTPPGFSVSMPQRNAHLSATSDYSQIAFVAGDRTHVEEVYVLETETGHLRCVTNFSKQMQSLKLQPSQVIQWRTADGVQVEGVLTKPANVQPHEKCPLIVCLHGGPAFFAALNQLIDKYDRGAYPIQLWVSGGSAVLQPNYRGSGGRGHVFRQLNLQKPGMGEIEDILAGIDALVEQGWVDADRIGICGWSYGGFLTALASTKTKRFAAASCGGAITDWSLQFSATDVPEFVEQCMQGTPWENPAKYFECSPVNYAPETKTAVLIQHSQNDVRVPVSNALSLHRRLIRHGGVSRLITYNMEHSPYRPKQCRHIMKENLDWFNHWLHLEEPELLDVEA